MLGEGRRTKDEGRRTSGHADFVRPSSLVRSPSFLTPRSFLACLPWLWSRVLFPGRNAAPERPRAAALLWLVLLPAALLYPCLSFWLFEPDEGRYAQIPAEMLARG